MPRFSDRTIEEIKNKIRLSDLVGEYAKLERKGSNFWARCPFHANGMEKTPSFKIDDQKGLYYCFGCHESGTIFTFIEKMEHLDFPAAVEYLASKSGVQLRESSTEDAKRKDESAVLFDLHERLSKTFSYILVEDKRGKDALGYIRARGISDEMISRFRLGFAPKDSSFLYTGKRFTQRGTPDDNDATVWQFVTDDGKDTFNFLVESDSALILLNDRFERNDSEQNHTLVRIR